MIYPEGRFLSREAREGLISQRGAVVWLYGLSGSGKSTIAALVERGLYDLGLLTAVLDGDNVRGGLNAGLGFSDEDRMENIRRIAHVGALMVQSGLIVLVSAITPKRVLRELAAGIVGEDLMEVYVKASFATCRERDPKGLYKRVDAGEVEKFTGRDSVFEEPGADSGAIILDTENHSPESCASQLIDAVRGRCLTA